MITSAEGLRADLFTPTDHCDRCGGPAQARVELRSGDLMFCLRHFREHHAALAPMLIYPPTFAF